MMKRLLSLLLLGLFSLACARTSAPCVKPLIKISVDPRVELMSIIFYFAGNKEYSECGVKQYQQDVDATFDRFRNHPAVVLARHLHQAHENGFDAPMSLAIRLPALDQWSSMRTLEVVTDGLDKRWTAEHTPEFLDKVRQFAVETRFLEFYQAHQKLYTSAIKEAELLVNKRGNLDWYGRFYGSHANSEHVVIIGMLNGGGNYGPEIVIDGKPTMYAIIGVPQCDKRGQPKLDRFAPIIIAHEISHSYVNPLVDAHRTELERSGNILFQQVSRQMKEMNYENWSCMVYESIVRAATIRYTQKTYGFFMGRLLSHMLIKMEVNRGFPWTEDLVKLLRAYETKRDQYPTFDNFFPRIVDFFIHYADAHKS